MLTLERLKETLEYNPDTGLFKNKINRGNVTAGTIAGSRHSRGYIQIAIDGVDYLAHNLAWFYMTGEWSTYLVDHRDRVESNNKWINLREATYSENGANSISKGGRSGIKGVFPHGSGWRARIKVNYKTINLGTFRTKEEASVIYMEAAYKYFGEFSE